MPAMGPNLDKAKQDSKIAYAQIRELLEKQYQVNPKGIFNDRAEKEEIEKHWQSIENAVEELFVQQASEDW